MDTPILITIITSIFSLLTLIVKQHFDHKTSIKNQENLKDIITDKDKKQDNEMILIKESLNKIESSIDKITYKTSLINKLRKTSNNIITVNSLDNSEFLALLNNTRDKYIEMIVNILDNKVQDINVDDLKTDIKTFAKYVKTITNFNAIDVLDKEAFTETLKLEVVLPNLNIFIMRLEDEILKDANKYNGTFEKIAVGILSNLITCIIKVYRDSKK